MTAPGGASRRRTPSSTPEGVARLAASLSAAERQTLRDLVRFPLASAWQLRAFNGRAGPSTDQERLARLAERGAVADLAYARPLGRAARLWHLTDLGLHAVAGVDGVDPASLAAKWRQYYEYYGRGRRTGRYRVDYPAAPPRSW